jgi:hypothetical protein
MNVKRVPAGLAVAAVTGMVTMAGCSPVTPPQYQYGAQAFGSRAVVAGTVTSGPSFLTQLGCTTQAPKASANNGAGSNLSALGTVGAIKGRTSSAAGKTISSTGVEDVSNVNLLGGQVTADAIHITSNTSRDAKGFHTAGKMTFVDLKVAGTPVRGDLPPNTAIALPGIGSVTLNEQHKSTAVNSAGLKVTALHIRTNASNVSGGLPLSADVVVGQASSGLTGAVIGRLGGLAYGTNLNIATLIGSGMSAPAYVPCGGTQGRLLTNATTGITVPDVATLGAVTDTARGTLNSTSGAAETTSNVAGTNLLSSLVTASAVKADARATVVKRLRTVSDAGSHFVGLHVQGFPGIGDNVPANTKLTIPNVGTLYLHRIIKSGNSIEVRMIELVLTRAQGALPVGADIKIAVASAVTV